MMNGKFIFSSALLFLCCTASMVHAADSKSNLEVIKLKNGINEVHFDGLDQKTLIVIAHRENYNAHSYDVTTLFVDYKPKDADDLTGLQIIPIFEKNQNNTLHLTVSGGADCVLHDYRLVRDTKTHETLLIVADRAIGDSYADTQSVDFTFYKLELNSDGVPGFPPFSFEYLKEQTAKQQYCDVEQAFQKELGLEEYRTDISEEDQ